MKKIITPILLLLFVPLFSIAQAYEGSIDYDKKKQAAFVVEYPFSPEAVENAIIAKMEKLGYKGKAEKGLLNKDKGFRKFKNAYITELHDQQHDYIFKVERKSRKEDDRTVVYLIMLKDDVNTMTNLDAYGLTRAKSFLNNLQPDIDASNLQLQIVAQEATVIKAEKKLKSLQDDKTDMEDKIRKLEDSIRENIKDQESTQKDLENQKALLETLRNKKAYM